MSARGSVIVVGGGLAGITAALDLAAAGREVTLLESRGRLGGQAYSFERDGIRADNGQHVFLRCCTAYRGLVERIGAGELVTLQERLDITVLGCQDSRRRRGRLNRTGLPAPLHLAGALLRYPFLSPRQRLSAAAAMAALARVDVHDPANDGRTFGEWLRAHRQHPRAIDALWDLITRPTVNLPAEQASLAQAAYVFQEGLLSSAAAGDLGHARVPLSEIHDVAAGAALRRAGVDVRLRAGVTAIEPGFTVRLSGRSPETLSAAAVVLAVGPERMARLIPAQAGVTPQSLRALGESPIVNVHVVFDRPVLDRPFAAGVGTPVQWVFDRTDSAGLASGQYLVVTLSAADAELGMAGEAVLERYLAALGELLPVAERGARVRRAFVTRDHAATFRAGPGQRALRPAAATALRGLALAGAHTDTGWPATMEGAVRSGHAAAGVVLAAGTGVEAAPSASVPSIPAQERAVA
ncbi:MAG TPA: hydroxysqualene dehydroxylase HpnE [Solirubrobacteraceae bacterium]|nr:hydroxysqualene dehydroxylase HpnE [Solirubrobacteraceae bacterium]